MQDSPICLFFDFDGTTFIDLKFPKEITDAIKNAQEHGCKVFMNTGRSIVNLFKDLKKNTDIVFDGYLCNFASIYLGNDAKNIVCEKFMDKKDVFAFIDYCEKYSYWATLDIEGQPPHTIKLHGDVVYSAEEKKQICDIARDIAKNFNIVKTCVYPPISVNYIATNLEEENPNVKWIQTERGYECGLSDKGTLLDEFAKLMDYDPYKFVVFGDSENDVDMFMHAKTSVAMAHAPKILRDKATFVMTEKYGVAEFLNKLFPKK
ncbi:MAG: HAD family phosphatase [Clostridia bacterium]|nr:HAD family phosphatase [Clostridia bacterium]